MELLAGIESRRSSRAFKPDPIPKDVMEKILATAGRSPSYTNTQPWEVVVVCGQKKDELSRIILELARAKAPTNPDIVHPQAWPPELEQRFREHGARRLATIGVARDDEEGREKLRLSNFEFYGAPCVVFIFMDSSLSQWSLYDVGLFSQSLVLAAHAFGVGSCLQASITNYPDAIRDFLEIPSDRKLVIGISMGYPDPEAVINTYQSTRISLDDFVRWYQ